MTINPIFPIKHEQQGEVYIRKDTTKLKFWSHVAPSIFPRAETRPIRLSKILMAESWRGWNLSSTVKNEYPPHISTEGAIRNISEKWLHDLGFPLTGNDGKWISYNMYTYVHVIIHYVEYSFYTRWNNAIHKPQYLMPFLRNIGINHCRILSIYSMNKPLTLRWDPRTLMDVPNAPPLFILGGEVRPLRHCGKIPTRPLCGVSPG